MSNAHNIHGGFAAMNPDAGQSAPRS